MKLKILLLSTLLGLGIFSCFSQSSKITSSGDYIELILGDSAKVVCAKNQVRLERPATNSQRLTIYMAGAPYYINAPTNVVPGITNSWALYAHILGLLASGSGSSSGALETTQQDVLAELLKVVDTLSAIYRKPPEPKSDSFYIKNNPLRTWDSLAEVKLNSLATEATLQDLQLDILPLATEASLNTIRANQINGNQVTTLSDIWGNGIDGRTLANSSPLNVAIVDGDGNQTTSFTIANPYIVQAADSTKYRKVVSVDNNVTTNQTLLTSGFNKVTDGSNTAVVKAGSTAPALADAALVTTISGNGTMFGPLTPSAVPTRQIVTGAIFNTTLPTVTTGQSLALQVDNRGRLLTSPIAATSTVSTTGVVGAGVTLTLPIPGAGLFHYISHIEITAYSTAARAGTATPITITTTNIAGLPGITFGTAAAIGTTDRYNTSFSIPLRSAVANTATTIVCPAVGNVIWRVNVFYYINQ